jgi:hypothetical protein
MMLILWEYKHEYHKEANKFRGLSPQANYTDSATGPHVGEVSANFCG